MNNKLLIYLVLTAFSLSLLACGGDKTNNKDYINKNKQDSLNLKLEIKPYKKIKLVTQVDSITRDWLMYNNLKNEVERMQDYTLQDLISNVLSIESAADSLQKTLPKALDTFPIQSRIKVLNTKAKFLLELSQKQQPKLKNIKHIAEEYPLEFNALNLQLNELYLELPDFDE